MAVNAFSSPPTASIAVAISSAVRVVGALEQQVLEEVRRAGQRRGLVPGADADPDADRAPSGRRARLGDDPQAAGQHGALDPAADLVEVEQLRCAPDGHRGGCIGARRRDR